MTYIPDPIEELVDPWGVEYKKMDDLIEQQRMMEQQWETDRQNYNQATISQLQSEIRQLMEELTWCKKLHEQGMDIDKWRFTRATVAVKTAPSSFLSRKYTVYFENNNLAYINEEIYNVDYKNKIFLMDEKLKEWIRDFLYLVGFSLSYRYFDRYPNRNFIKGSFGLYYGFIEIAISVSSTIAIVNALKNLANTDYYELGFGEVWGNLNAENIGLNNGIGMVGEIDSLWPFVWENMAYMVSYPQIKDKIWKNKDPEYVIELPNVRWKDVNIEIRIQNGEIIFVKDNSLITGKDLSDLGYQYARASYYGLVYMLANKILGKNIKSLNVPKLSITGTGGKFFEFINNISYILWTYILFWKEYGLFINEKFSSKNVIEAFGILNEFLDDVATNRLTLKKYYKFKKKYMNKIDPNIGYILRSCAVAYNQFANAPHGSYEEYLANQARLLWHRCNNRWTKNRQLIEEIISER